MVTGRLAEDGFELHRDVFHASQLHQLILLTETQLQRREGRGGVRNLLDTEAMRDLAVSKQIRRLVEPVLGPSFFAVRGILFDKTPDANWKVPWHQDVTIAVRERVEAPGYGPWSVKEGVTHVQPPVDVLNQLLTVRVHLDDCPASNGALRVIPGTHLLGKLNEVRAAQIATEREAINCECEAGGALVMRPLLLHSSSATTVPTHRRVLHFDFAAQPLPGGPVWRTGG